MIRSEELVFRLSWLGFRFIAGIVGLMKEGEAGSDVSDDDDEVPASGGWIDSPFIFRARLGDGEVIGLSGDGVSETVNAAAIADRPPNDVAGNDESGTRLMGESGDDEGDGSERGDESVVDSVVVGDESADSDAWVDVLSWCL